jgi:hypothetical protein
MQGVTQATQHKRDAINGLDRIKLTWIEFGVVSETTMVLNVSFYLQSLSTVVELAYTYVSIVMTI